MKRILSALADAGLWCLEWGLRLVALVVDAWADS